jgi:predicted DNA-binding transcriptional regulator AlpA
MGRMEARTEGDRIVRLRDVLRICSVSRSQVYRLMRAGTFPASLMLGQRARGWRLSDIQAWIQTRPTKNGGAHVD